VTNTEHDEWKIKVGPLCLQAVIHASLQLRKHACITAEWRNLIIIKDLVVCCTCCRFFAVLLWYVQMMLSCCDSQ